MPEPLKNVYSTTFFQRFAKEVKTVYPSFEETLFLNKVLNDSFEKMELKERMRHSAECFYNCLPDNYPESIEIVLQLISYYRNTLKIQGGLEHFFLPDIVLYYGKNDLTTSVRAMEEITQFITCEFAVRPFLLNYPEQMQKQMVLWSKHKSRHVRRLASEGFRPRLPWGMGIPALKKDPSPILPVLENLKNDSCEIVRRSVANNLNDISKDHPELFMKMIRQWKNYSPQTDHLIKHASRTLLKAGHKAIFDYYGLKNDFVQLSDFKISTPIVKNGENLSFCFSLKNTDNKAVSVRLEYGIYFLRNNGKHNKKVFKISEKLLSKGEIIYVEKIQSFKPITTRNYYTGLQKVSIIVNGHEIACEEFELIE